MNFDDQDVAGKGRARLDSWKRIAAYLGRAERTVRRWEKQEHLPVYRHNHGAHNSVYGYSDEIDAWLISRSSVPGPAPVMSRRVRIAVLPFDDFTGSEHIDFCDGVTEGLINALGVLGGAKVGIIAHSSIMRFKHDHPGVTEIGKVLSVDHIVEGSVRVIDHCIKLSVRLVRVSDQITVLTVNQTNEGGQLISMQEKFARSIAVEILGDLLSP